jgi:hypothetical protein
MYATENVVQLTIFGGSEILGALSSRNSHKAPTVTPVAELDQIRSKQNVRARAKAIRRLEESPTLLLFTDLLEILKAPLLRQAQLLNESLEPSEIGEVALPDDDGDEEVLEGEDRSIQYEAWGEPWVTDDKGLHWSREGLLFTQVRLFWRSLEELAFSNTAQENWSVLRWIFRPTIWKYYVYDQQLGRSHTLEVHERNEPFSFHNCCMAARMDEDMVRDGVRRNMPDEVIQAVEKVCTF